MREVMIARREHDAVAFALLAREREQRAQQRREIFLDVRRDHTLDPRVALNALHAGIEPGQRDDCFDPVLPNRRVQLVFPVCGIQRRDDGADFPGGELGDEELRAVRQHEPDSVAARDAERHERRCERVAQRIERAVAERRAFEEHSRRFWMIASMVGKIVEQRAAGIWRKRRGDAAVVVSNPGRRLVRSGRHRRRHHRSRL